MLDDALALIDSTDISPLTRSAFLVQRGRHSYEMGRLSTAVVQLRAALDLLEPETEAGNEYYLVASTLVSYLIEAEQYEEARQLAERVAEQVSRNGAELEAQLSVTHHYAIALEVTGDIERAFEQYQNALLLQREFQAGNLLGLPRTPRLSAPAERRLRAF